MTHFLNGVHALDQPGRPANPFTRRQLPRPTEWAPLLRLERPTLDPVARRLRRAADIADLRATARRVTPRAVFDYVDGGADGEVSLRALREHYRRIEFRPRVLRDVSAVEPSTTMLGRESRLPLAFAPTGYTRMMHHEGEIAVGRAAAELGVPYGLSTMATTSPEDVSACCPDAALWFQLYVWPDREASRRLVERAWSAGFTTLVLTVDTAIVGNRLRDVHNGLSIPPRLTARTVADMALHPTWWVNKLTTPVLRFACVPEEWSSEAESNMGAGKFDPALDFGTLEWLRALWPGSLLVKGVQTVTDARAVVDSGADGVILSSHGGRQLDRSPLLLDLLPEVVAECGDRAEILIDGGILRGSDVVAAVALGARAALVGRAYLYGLMAGGPRGVRRAGEILEDEIRTTMALLGARTVGELSPDLVHLP